MTNDHYTGLHRYKTLPSSQTPLLDSAGRVTMEVKLRSGRKRKFMTAEAWVLDGSFPWSHRESHRSGAGKLGNNPELKPSRNEVRRSAPGWPELSLAG